MKRLILVRHAKSGWKNTRMADFNRPLTKKGKADALTMGKRLWKNKLKPDLIISSPAKRALATAKMMAREIKYPLGGILMEPSIYNSDVPKLLKAVRNVNNAVQKLMIVGHNPEFSEFCNFLIPTKIEDYPTSSVVIIDLNVKGWKGVSSRKGTLVSFDHPKRI
ncbi:MAG: histidine phosphatase family protein [Candidatus Omnitrophica bacterium]|nr:histidine phosphatase family protein [Candidatus Omnitrophota bacterium]